MLKPTLKALEFLLEGAGIIGTIGTVATVGDILAKRAGLFPKDKSILNEATQFVVDVSGFSRSGGTAGAPPQLGAAPVAVCPLCQADKPLNISGPAVLKNCENHESAVVALGGYTESMFDEWAKHVGIDIGDIEAKPRRETFVTPSGFNVLGYNAALVQWQESAFARKAADIGAASKCGKKPAYSDYKKFGPASMNMFTNATAQWQTCIQAERDAAEKAKADKAAQDKLVQAAKEAGTKHGSEIQKKFAAQLLVAQQKKSDQAIADLKAQYAAEQDAEKQAQIQAQIDAANAAKAASDKALADLQAKVTSDAQAKQVADLQAQVLTAGQKSGGMDQLMQYLMMQQMQSQQQMAPQTMVAPDGSADGGAMPWSAPGEFVPMVEQEPEMYFEGAAESNLGTFFGLQGLSDDDGQILFNGFQSGSITREDIEALLREQEMSGGACLSGCSIPR